MSSEMASSALISCMLFGSDEDASTFRNRLKAFYTMNRMIKINYPKIYGSAKSMYRNRPALGRLEPRGACFVSSLPGTDRGWTFLFVFCNSRTYVYTYICVYTHRSTYTICFVCICTYTHPAREVKSCHLP